MYSPFAPEDNPESRDAKKRITKQLSSCIRSLQIRFVTTDDVVTSEDNDANGLCVALEAVFIHGLKPKFVKLRRNRGSQITIPHPSFWAVLKPITHRNVIKEIESIHFLKNDVARCRSWLRLAVNDGLMECYFISLKREKSRLMEYYQPHALLLDAEDCDVVLSYLQGLSSLVFSLSHKSSLLCEWTTTPLSLSGLWIEDNPQALVRRKSADSMSHSSNSDDTTSSILQENKESNETSSLSVDTNSSSSQLSSSAGSDRQATEHGNTTPIQPGSPDLSSRELDIRKTQSEDPEVGISPVQDKAFFIPILNSSFQEAIEFSTETLRRLCLKSDSRIMETKTRESADLLKSQKGNSIASREETNENNNNELLSSCQTLAARDESIKPLCVDRGAKSGCEYGENLSTKCPFTDIPKSKSWISEDDFHHPKPDSDTRNGNHLPAKPVNQTDINSDQAPEQHSKTFNVIHRRHTGLPNPFRGLLMIGSLERKNGLGFYKSFHCELTPYEFRIFVDEEEKLCLENWSLLRCESVSPAHSDGRFELHFSAKKLCLRAASQDEAKDWVERVEEAISAFRPHEDETWEVLDADSPRDHKNKPFSVDGSQSSSEPCNWISPFEVEPDALKESVLYMKIQKKWAPFIFSLSERVLRCFLPKASEKKLQESYSIETIRDVLPDASLGNASCFRLVTSKGTLQLQAESSVEAKAWRELVRAAYLEWEEDSAFVPGDGNFHIKSNIREHHLFKYLMYIPTERGLDAQDFKCAGCHKKIGFQFGKAKLCEFSGLYYCDFCHQDQYTVIPSRMVHNWDVTERAVSQQAINFLNMVQNEPLFNVQYLNERLYSHTYVMYQMRSDRERLRLLAEYLITCRSGAVQELGKRLDQRSYLLDCSHTYSMWDLKQITTSVFERVMMSSMEFACDHVYTCALCSQKGFICLICNKDEIIYPFQFESTTRCGDCKAVFHIRCKTDKAQCPRCKRRKKY